MSNIQCNGKVRWHLAIINLIKFFTFIFKLNAIQFSRNFTYDILVIVGSKFYCLIR